MRESTTEPSMADAVLKSAVRRRRWFFFSLRTLLLFVLTICAAAAIVEQWTPWVRMRQGKGVLEGSFFSEDSRLYSVENEDWSVSVIETESGRERGRVALPARGYGDSQVVGERRIFSEDGSKIVIVRNDCSAFLCDTDGPQSPTPLLSTEQTVSAAFSADGLLISADENGTRVWDVSSSQMKYSVPDAHEKGSKWAYDLSPNSKYYAFATDETILIRNLSDGSVQWTISNKDCGPAFFVRFGSTGRLLIWHGADRYSEVDPEDGVERQLFTNCHLQPDESIIAVSRDTRQIATLNGRDAVIIDAETGQRRRTFKDFKPHSSGMDARFTLSGSRLVVLFGGWNPNVIWNTESGGHQFILAPVGYYNVVRLSPDERYFMASGPESGHYELWRRCRDEGVLRLGLLFGLVAATAVGAVWSAIGDRRILASKSK